MRPRRSAAAAGAVVVLEPRRGYGYACAAGSAAAHGDILVYLDGDGSFLPAEMPRLIEPLRAGAADLVLGSRVLGHIAAGAMPPHQRFGNWLAASLMRGLYRVQVTDLGPYRAVRRDLLEELNMREMTFGWPTEMMVKAARRGRASTKCRSAIWRAPGGARRWAATCAAPRLRPIGS